MAPKLEGALVAGPLKKLLFLRLPLAMPKSGNLQTDKLINKECGCTKLEKPGHLSPPPRA